MRDLIYLDFGGRIPQIHPIWVAFFQGFKILRALLKRIDMFRTRKISQWSKTITFSVLDCITFNLSLKKKKESEDPWGSWLCQASNLFGAQIRTLESICLHSISLAWQTAVETQSKSPSFS